MLDANAVLKRAEEKIDSHPGTHCPMQILVAEDNLVNKKVTGMILKKMGYEPDYAIKGRQAVDMAMMKHYDVILMDIQMPIMDELMATCGIRLCVAKDKQPVIIALTAHALAEETMKRKDAGMDEYITKPFNAAMLGRALADVYHGIITHHEE